MKMRPGAEPRTAGVADDVALSDVLVAAHGDARLVAVCGREPVVVVDDDEVAVARLPAAPDDGAGRGRVDGRALGDADVDARMEASPTRAERAGDRPDEPGRARRRRRSRPAVAAASLGGADPRLDGRARRLDRLRLVDRSLLLCLRDHEQMRLAG